MRQRSTRSRRGETIAFFGFVTPWFVGFLAFSALPLVVSVLMSLTRFNLYGFKDFRFVGLANYRAALEDPYAREALKNTAVFAAIIVPLGIAVQIGLAVLVNTTASWRGVFRTVFYLPAVIPAVASILLIWRVALFGTNGAADRVYHLFDPDGQILWLDQHGRLILILFMVWSTAGLGMMVFLAGLQNMSRELQEAARADGATRSQIFRTITLPLLTPVIFLQLVLGLISTSQMMIQPILFGSGDYGGQSPFFWVPRRGTDVLSSEIWGSSFRSFALSYGAALSWILFLIVLAITLLLFGTSKRWVFYNAD